MKKSRIVITGIGILSPNGKGKTACWNALLEGKSGISTISLFDASDYSCQIAGEIKDFDPTERIPRKETMRMDRYTQFAVSAAMEAVEDSGLVIEDKAERVGVIVGSGIGGLSTLEKEHKELLANGPRRVSPFLIPMMISNLAAGYTAIMIGAKGICYAPVSACATSAHAIGEGYEAILRGDIDCAVVGGSEAAVTPLGVAGFASMKALSTRNDQPQRASRPFDQDRDGFVMSEGAGMLVLEKLEDAEARGARIYCEVLGYGATADAYHMVQPAPHGEGAARAMNMALKDGSIQLGEVDYINAHGTSTQLNDSLETEAIRAVFGDHADKLLISSTKSMTGHLLGAAGGLEGAICAMSIQNSIVAPTINLDNQDPQCDLNYVPHRPVDREIRVALSNSLGFGGQNVCLAFGKHTRETA